jgi:hypothetical protein
MPDLGTDGPMMLIDLRGRRPAVNEKAAKTLFQIWRDEKNKVGDYRLKRPTSISITDVDMMTREGLVKSKGDTIEITPKGVEIIKTMILGNDKSAFEDDGRVLDYHTACANLKPRKKAKSKTASVEEQDATWWRRLKNNGYFE